MSTIVTRAGKGSPLTWNEVDNNFTNLNTDKYQSGSNVSLGTIAGTTITSSALTATRIPFASTGGLLTDSANLSFDGSNLFVSGLISTNQSLNFTGSGSAPSAGYGVRLKSGVGTEVVSSYQIGFSVNGGTSDAALLDSSGNVGIGVTPSTWTDYKALEIGGLGSAISALANNITVGSNAYYNSGWKYSANNVAPTQYVQGSGKHYWYNAPNGGASAIGTAVTFTERMQLDASGNLLVGTTSGSEKVTVAGNMSSTANGTFYIDGTNPGAVGNPTYSWLVDTDTGMYRIQANTIGFATAGTERMRIDSSGNLGLGTASPDVILTINKNQADGVKIRSANTNGTRLSLGVDTVAGITYIASSREGSGTYMPLAFYTSDLEGMRLDTSGNLSLRGGLALNTNQGPYWNGGVAYISYNNASNFMSFGAASAERMRIDSSGNLFVGTTASVGGAAAKLTISTPNLTGSFGGIGIKNEANANGGYFLHFVNYNNAVIGSISQNATTTVAYNTSSDYRLKENIAPMVGALDKVALLKPVTYTWKDGGADGQGFIAHELAEVVPDCVTGEKDATREEEYEISPAIPAVLDEEGNEVTPAVEAVMGTRTVPVYQGIDTSFLVATLTAAIQEQQVMIDELKAKVAALEAA